MLLAAILLVCSAPQSAGMMKAEGNFSTEKPSISASESPASAPQPAPPTAPQPKIATDADRNAAESGIAMEPRYTPGAPKSLAPAKGFLGQPYETSRQRKIWYALSFAGAGAATFDAWSTRRAISQGYGVEGNPMLRPFSHSGVLYAATQVSPLVMDFVGKRMMVSQHRLLRKVWWLPQAAGATVSLAAGVHNVRLVP